jgi:hypothetical protein
VVPPQRAAGTPEPRQATTTTATTANRRAS